MRIVQNALESSFGRPTIYNLYEDFAENAFVLRYTSGILPNETGDGHVTALNMRPLWVAGVGAVTNYDNHLIIPIGNVQLQECMCDTFQQSREWIIELFNTGVPTVGALTIHLYYQNGNNYFCIQNDVAGDTFNLIEVVGGAPTVVIAGGAAITDTADHIIRILLVGTQDWFLYDNGVLLGGGVQALSQVDFMTRITNSCDQAVYMDYYHTRPL